MFVDLVAFFAILVLVNLLIGKDDLEEDPDSLITNQSAYAHKEVTPKE